MKILFLHTELSDYTLACLRQLKKSTADMHLLVVHFPVNPEAPFKFDFSDIGQFTCVNDFPDYSSFEKVVSQFKADKIVCSGWINKWYVRFCRRQKSESLTIVASDNAWNGNWKQQVLRGLSPFTIRNIFHKMWIPGDPQMAYARKMGFKNQDILTGYYSCDVDRFKSLYERTRESKSQNFPRRFLCVARYIPAKGYEFLWNAFIEWKKAYPNNWELWCAGTGSHFDQRMQHSDIRHLGFVHRKDWEKIVAQTGVFVLPSKFEPWGVAVHEFAASGFPLLLSGRVGAASAFLSVKNGFSFDPGNKNELIDCFERFSSMSVFALNSMSAASVSISEKITPQLWAHTLLNA